MPTYHISNRKFSYNCNKGFWSDWILESQRLNKNIIAQFYNPPRKTTLLLKYMIILAAIAIIYVTFTSILHASTNIRTKRHFLEPAIALTFDDGPTAEYTPDKVLDILKKYNVKATFFVMGTICARTS